ncbi:hypothetical protein BVC93_16860 [Mycobacterium sp. MS1601]|uniref:hypothetical protein n=1 Tax=Mycobacterium sp. MS1601 TaxID=1936029 RepID=UPI0009795B5E|nr:hypothetical protein [Mycobacterium sp. MS1601]AQA03824.1 hypothetical protein BVC93_16860 [Mycobacterium sp. MS1601]
MTTFLRLLGNLPVLASVTIVACVAAALWFGGWIGTVVVVVGVWMMFNAAIVLRARQRQHDCAPVGEQQDTWS